VRWSLPWIALITVAFWVFWSLVNLALGDGFPGALEVAGKAVGLGVAAGFAFFWFRRLYRRVATLS
jgi:hypothetical protein